MIEKIIIEYLTEQLSGIPVVAERPTKDIPDTFIMIDKTGSNKSNHIKGSTVAIQSYGPSLLAAAELNERLKDVMESMVTRDDVSAVRLNTDYNFSDTSSKVYRYQAVFDIVYY